MLMFSKLTLLAIYAIALAGLAGKVIPAIAQPIETIALALVLVHALEVAYAFKYLKRYSGGLPASIALTMLFGLLHWRRLMRP
ncbi:MAG: hypothetical protein V4508_06630 [Pseudomonadota bacterium]